MRQHLHDLGEEDPRSEKSECDCLILGAPVLTGSRQQHELERVEQQSGSLELADIDDVEAPPESWETPVRLVRHHSKVSAPVSPSPADALMDVVRILFQGCLDDRMRIELECDIPAVRVYIPSQTLVVVRVQLAAKPRVGGEVCRELLGLEDLGSVSCGAT